jgi:hypothetical protein
MVIYQYDVNRENVLAIVDQAIQQLSQDEVEAAFIVVGTDAHRMLRKAIGERFQRGAGNFDTYQYIPIVLDPFRTREVCVVPAASSMADGVRGYSITDE